MPGVSTGIDAATALTGKNPLTGESVGWVGRGVAVAGILTPLAGGQIRGLGRSLRRGWAKLTRGSSSGRTAAANLTEQLAMKQAMSDPLSGQVTPLVMGDPRWPAEDGWVKMRQNINGVEIHYVRNTKTGAVEDYKFKDQD